jgi:GPH family glycoside/pentoside/hexuronide:cation symporter
MTESLLGDTIEAGSTLKGTPEAPEDIAQGHPRLPVRDKILYSAGDMVDGTIAYAIGAYLFYYLTANCGLSGSLASAALAISIVVDAVMDPMIGFVSDNTRSRWGRRHPYMILSALPTAVALGMIFSVPDGLSGVGLFAYVLVALLVLRIGMSAFTLPYAALGAELTANYAERSTVVAYRTFFNIAANIATWFLALQVFLKAPDGHLRLLERDAYAPFAWCVAGVMLAGALTSGLATLRLRNRIHTIPHTASASPIRLLVELKDVARNRSFVVLFLCIMLFWAAQGTIAVLNLHVVKYFWKLPDGMIQALPLFSFAGLFTGIPIAGIVLQKLEKRVVAIWPLAILCGLHILLPLMRVMGLLPEGGMPLWVILAVGEVLKGWAASALGIAFWSMLADAADEHEYLFGSRREGLYFAGLTFSAKAAIGLGSVVAGVAFDLIGFPQDLARVGEVRISAEVARNLGLIQGPLAGFIALLSAAVLVLYKLDVHRYREIQTELHRRKTTP